jgi:tetratricopeptide (TPR) repeat protein
MRRQWIWWTAGVVLAVAALVAHFIARHAGGLPQPGSPQYEATTTSFYRGLAELQVGLLDDAKRDFQKAADTAAREPAAWANLGLAHLRLGEFDAAAEPIAHAVLLAPNSSDLVFLQGRLETSRGKLDEGLARYRRAVELDPGNMRARYALAEEIERADGPDADAQAEQQFDAILKARPGNLAVLLERARLSAKRGDASSLDEAVRTLNQYVAGWPEPAVEQYGALKAAAASRNFQDAARDVAFLRNVLVRTTVFRESLTAVRTPTELIAAPLERFLVLPTPSSKPSPPDEQIKFEAGMLWVSTGALATVLNESGNPAVLMFDDHAVTLDQSGGVYAGLHQPPPALIARIPDVRAVLPLDWNRDFKMDFAVAGRRGLRLLTQQANGSFADATAKVGSPINTDCYGVWTADIELDGDLDLIVGVRGEEPIVLRNNGDGTAKPLKPFGGVVGLRGFAWADLDGDGDPDAALLGERGDVHLFENRQGGEFREMRPPADLGTTVALAIGDVNGNGVLNLVTLDSTGAIRRFARKGDVWEAKPVAKWADPIDARIAVGNYRLFLADMDNSGAVDVVASGDGRTRIWLAGSNNDFARDSLEVRGDVFSVADMNGDGQLDMVGVLPSASTSISNDGQAFVSFGRGEKGYHWQVMRPKAQPTAGDQRINSFGVGGSIQIRSGLLTQSQILTGQPAHFGLGTRTGIDVAEIFWPNGIMQADFDRKADQSIVAEQRLKGSCPWVFTYDGTGMRFVTDFLWRSPLGLRINAQDTAGVTQTEDWVKIRGDQLVARNGAYDVRITAELWETHFIDHVALLVVDHPGDIEVFVDERFAREAPALAVHAVRNVRPIAHAWDEAGRDVTDVVASRDGRYLSTFARGPYQGIAQDHDVEIDLGREAGPGEWLVANGWIYPTDSSINVAIGQAGIQPHGIALEAQEPSGHWKVVAPDLGFPAGKSKTILIDLGQVTRAGIPHARRVRLRTNLEIYWDALAVADAAPAGTIATTRVQASKAELRYRGFSKTDFSRRDAPETPRYGELANVVQRWRDLVGYYTRYGDVAELLASVDDRYVIMNAGDELRLLFPEPEPVSPKSPRATKSDRSMSRDFVLVGDGWEKDGDYNTTFSKTVAPLPRHGRPEYAAAPPTGNIEDDPVYRAHPADWQRYHTRFVAPERFLNGLR